MISFLYFADTNKSSFVYESGIIDPHRMKGWRWVCSLTNVVIYVSFTFVGFVTYYLVRMPDRQRWFEKPAPCSFPEDVQEDFIEMAARISELFEEQGISYFLCYGTLWGALRMKKMLPWDNDLDICVLRQDIHKVADLTLHQFFRMKDLGISYKSKEGVYDIRFGKARGDIVVFDYSSDFEWVHRIGWATRILPIEEDRFPSRLIAPPLPKQKFHNLNLPVPRESLAIQKYFYPHDWWKIVKPPNCQTVNAQKGRKTAGRLSTLNVSLL
jgi:hypothetical protein